MNILIKWKKCLTLADGSKKNMIYDVDLNNIPDTAGVYVFCRKYKTSLEPLYVGKAKILDRRIKGQLNNLKLMQRIKKAKSGERFLLFGEVRATSADKIDKKLLLAEKSLIRHFLGEGYNLFNKQGVHIKLHEVKSEGRPFKKLIPETIYLEKSKS